MQTKRVVMNVQGETFRMTTPGLGLLITKEQCSEHI